MTAVQKQEKHADQLLKSATDKEITEEENNAWMKDCNVSGDRNIRGFFFVFPDCRIFQMLSVCGCWYYASQFLAGSLTKLLSALQNTKLHPVFLSL